MKTIKNQISDIRINRLRIQGYLCETNSEVSNLSFGIRFAYRLCVTLLIPGVLFANIPLLSIMMAVAIASTVLPYHPFDYIYNRVLSKRMNLPQLPPRSAQLKFACAIATLFIGATIYLFSHNLMMAGYIAGSLLIASALLVGTTDICVPSILYNAMFRKNVKPSGINS